MRAPIFLMLAGLSAAAQTPLVRILNTTHPASRKFQVGNQFEILITAAPHQPISVRTTMQGRTDWGPAIASTDDNGRWSTTGRFAKSDFGGWRQVWTVGGKLASPTIQFFVGAPCVPEGEGFVAQSGPNIVTTCDTALGSQTFSAPSLSDSFRTPDGRVVPGRTPESLTPDEYHTEILQNLITGADSDIETAHVAHVSLQSSSGGLGDDVAGLIAHLVGINALSDAEIRTLLAVIRAAFERPDTIAPSARSTVKTLALLHRLADFTDEPSLKQQIADTIAYVQTR